MPTISADNQEVSAANKAKMASAAEISPNDARQERGPASLWGVFRGIANRERVVSAAALSPRVALLSGNQDVRSDSLQVPNKLLQPGIKTEFAPAGEIPAVEGRQRAAERESRGLIVESCARKTGISTQYSC
jgi:hypothetical protein